MHKVYDKWPQQAHEAYKSDIETENFTNIDHIVFAGMGGSGTIGDLFAAIFSKNPIHISVVKGYQYHIKIFRVNYEILDKTNENKN